MKRRINNDNLRRRKRRAFSIRKKIEGTSARPRLTVFRSNHHIYAQLIDDDAGKTLAASSTRVTALKTEFSGLKKSDAAELVGKKIAENAQAAGVTTVVFDRNGYPFHGRVAALAKGAREAGLQF
jgi:large subunit ribosomal protein L18